LTAPPPTEQPYLARRQNWSTQQAGHALMQPSATALRFLGHNTTWGDLERRVTSLAGALSRRGVLANVATAVRDIDPTLKTVIVTGVSTDSADSHVIKVRCSFGRCRGVRRRRRTACYAIWATPSRARRSTPRSGRPRCRL
jgi:hypothetical protein